MSIYVPAIIVLVATALTVTIAWGANHALDARAAARERDEARAELARYEEFVNNVTDLARSNKDDYFARAFIGQVRVFRTPSPLIPR